MSNQEEINRKANILQNEIVGYVKSSVLIIAAKYQLQKYLSNTPIRVEDLAIKLGFNPEATFRFLRLLETFELVSLINNKEVIETVYTQYLEGLSSDHYLKGYLAFEEFEYSLVNKTECWSKKFGENFYDYLKNHSETASKVAKYCQKTGEYWLLSVLDLYNFSHFKKIIDIGGGNGYFLSLILKKYSGATGIIFELPEVITESKKYVESLNTDIQKNIEIQSGNFFEHIPTSGDVYVLCRVMLNWGDIDASKILNNVAKILGADSKIVIIDFIIPNKDHPHYQRALLHDLNLLAGFGGSIRNKTEWENLLDKSNLKIEKFIITGVDISHEPNVPLCIIEAAKKRSL